MHYKKDYGDYAGMDPAGCNSGLPVTGIWARAFQDLEWLTKVVIPDGFTAIGENAFKGCTNLTQIHYGGTKAQRNKAM